MNPPRVRRLVAAAALVLGLGALACDDDVPEDRWIEMVCQQYEACGLLADLQIFGASADDCVSRYVALVKSEQAVHPDPARNTNASLDCSKVDGEACFKAFKAQDCDDLKANKQVAACRCVSVGDAGRSDKGVTADSAR